MERDTLRLECLRLATQRTPSHDEGMLRAEEYFKFVTKVDENEEPKKLDVKVEAKVAEDKPAKKKSDNVKSLV